MKNNKKVQICAPSNNALESLLVRLKNTVPLYDYRKETGQGYKVIKIGRLDEELSKETINFNIDYVVSNMLHKGNKGNEKLVVDLEDNQSPCQKLNCH